MPYRYSAAVYASVCVLKFNARIRRRLDIEHSRAVEHTPPCAQLSPTCWSGYPVYNPAPGSRVRAESILVDNTYSLTTMRRLNFYATAADCDHGTVAFLPADESRRQGCGNFKLSGSTPRETDTVYKSKISRLQDHIMLRQAIGRDVWFPSQ